MTVYGKTTEDLESGQVPKPSRSWMWNVFTLVGLLAICAVGALLFTWHLQKREKALPETLPESETGGYEQLGHHEALKQLAGSAKAAIHLEGDVNETKFKTSVEWNDRVGHAFSQGDLELKDNNITINHSGPYFVYSQASFKVQCGPFAKDQGPLSHTVMRFSESYSGQKELLSTVQTACRGAIQGPKHSQSFFNTIYLGAVFHLESGDRLWTETNHIGEVETDNGKTFFGVFAL